MKESSNFIYNHFINSTETMKNYEKIFNESIKTKKKYIYTDFHPTYKIFESEKNLLENITWKRIEEIYKAPLFENINYDSIKQGQIGNCYFIAVLVAISRKPDFVIKLFHPLLDLNTGSVCILFQSLGKFIPIIIDTLIPFNNKSNQPTFSKPKSLNDSPWFCLIEKAFAKLFGGYSHIVGRNASVNYIKFFGFFPESLKFTQIPLNYFDILNQLKLNNCFLTSFIENKSQEQLIKSKGLVYNHAYAILDLKKVENKLFIQLRNPWGNFEWNGDYSDKSNLWNSKLKQELDYLNNDDGRFWMLWNDFIKFFTSISVYHPMGLTENSVSFSGIIEPSDNDNRHPFGENPGCGNLLQYSIKFSSKGLIKVYFEKIGGDSTHYITLQKKNGKKIDKLDNNIYHSAAMESELLQFNYDIQDISEEWTFLITRNPSNKITFYNLIITSNSKIIGNIISEKNLNNLNKITIKDVLIPGDTDGRSVYSDSKTATCNPQYKLNFSESGPILIEFKKTGAKTNHSLAIMEREDPINFCYNKYLEKSINSNSNYEKWEWNVTNKTWFLVVTRDSNDLDSNYEINIYSSFLIKFEKYPNLFDIPSFSYKIDGQLLSGNNDGRSPYNTNKDISILPQSCINVTKKAFIHFILKRNGKSQHFIHLEKKLKYGEKMTIFYKNSIYKTFNSHPNSIYDVFTFQCQPGYWYFTVSRDIDNRPSKFEVELILHNPFEFYY